MTTATSTKTVTCRLAQADEGPLLQRLMRQAAGPLWDWLDWSRISPGWLIAEYQGEPVGCIMVLVGAPFCRIEMLCIVPSVSKRLRSMIARELVYTALAVGQAQGSTAATAMVGWSNDQWLKIWQRRGAIPYAEGVFLVKPLGVRKP